MPSFCNKDMERDRLLHLGRLLQQFFVDAHVAIEKERFQWIRNNQKKLRAEMYKGFMGSNMQGRHISGQPWENHNLSIFAL